ncbi:MAG: sulfite exporter TauE/SafE family protein [Acidobacteria bacterium]|nr:sulfite exporter TauE/SafE family protein [Acidobacteriota bacterium]
MFNSYIPELAVITFGAAIVNGALGYGFSSITVPLALLFLSNRLLNPALVLIEVFLNAYVLWVNRDALAAVRARVWPIVVGLVPGVVIGTLVVTQVRPDWLKLVTYLVLLPLILLQAAGLRRAIRAERSFGYPFGAGVGVLYSVTTISGPPLAVFLNNQGLAKREFRAALGFVRLAESTFTAMAYVSAGLFTRESLALTPAIVPSLIVGVPLGAWLIRRVNAETFRRVCMSFDAWVVGFGLSRVVQSLGLAAGAAAYTVMAVVVVIDAVLLYRFFALGHASSLTSVPDSLPS